MHTSLLLVPDLPQPGPAAVEQACRQEERDEGDERSDSTAEPPAVLEVDVGHAQVDHHGGKGQEDAIHD